MKQQQLETAEGGGTTSCTGETAGLDAVRGALGAELPALLDHARAGYRDFATVPPSQGAKAFNAHHAACRAALSHIDLLIKLARWCEGGPGDGGRAGGEDTGPLIAAARAALAHHRAEDT